MSRQLSAETIGIVKQSVPALEAHGSDITKAMYARLFRDEHIRNLFNHANLFANTNTADVSGSTEITGSRLGNRRVQLGFKFEF